MLLLGSDGFFSKLPNCHPATFKSEACEKSFIPITPRSLHKNSDTQERSLRAHWRRTLSHFLRAKQMLNHHSTLRTIRSRAPLQANVGAPLPQEQYRTPLIRTVNYPLFRATKDRANLSVKSLAVTLPKNCTSTEQSRQLRNGFIDLRHQKANDQCQGRNTKQ